MHFLIESKLHKVTADGDLGRSGQFSAASIQLHLTDSVDDRVDLEVTETLPESAAVLSGGAIAGIVTGSMVTLALLVVSVKKMISRRPSPIGTEKAFSRARKAAGNDTIAKKLVAAAVNAFKQSEVGELKNKMATYRNKLEASSRGQAAKLKAVAEADPNLSRAERNQISKDLDGDPALARAKIETARRQSGSDAPSAESPNQGESSSRDKQGWGSLSPGWKTEVSSKEVDEARAEVVDTADEVTGLRDNQLNEFLAAISESEGDRKGYYGSLSGESDTSDDIQFAADTKKELADSNERALTLEATLSCVSDSYLPPVEELNTFLIGHEKTNPQSLALEFVEDGRVIDIDDKTALKVIAEYSTALAKKIIQFPNRDALLDRLDGDSFFDSADPSGIDLEKKFSKVLLLTLIAKAYSDFDFLSFSERNKMIESMMSFFAKNYAGNLPESMDKSHKRFQQGLDNHHALFGFPYGEYAPNQPLHDKLMDKLLSGHFDTIVQLSIIRADQLVREGKTVKQAIMEPFDDKSLDNILSKKDEYNMFTTLSQADILRLASAPESQQEQFDRFNMELSNKVDALIKVSEAGSEFANLNKIASGQIFAVHVVAEVNAVLEGHESQKTIVHNMISFFKSDENINKEVGTLIDIIGGNQIPSTDLAYKNNFLGDSLQGLNDDTAIALDKILDKDYLNVLADTAKFDARFREYTTTIKPGFKNSHNAFGDRDHLAFDKALIDLLDQQSFKKCLKRR